MGGGEWCGCMCVYERERGDGGESGEERGGGERIPESRRRSVRRRWNLCDREAGDRREGTTQRGQGRAVGQR